MAVFWTIRARRHLRQALADALGREHESGVASRQEVAARGEVRNEAHSCIGVLEMTMDRLNDILAGLFEGASVVVKDQVLGYRRKKDLFILMVEAFGGTTREERAVRGQDRPGIRQLEKEIQRLGLLPAAGA